MRREILRSLSVICVDQTFESCECIYVDRVVSLQLLSNVICLFRGDKVRVGGRLTQLLHATAIITIDTIVSEFC